MRIDGTIRALTELDPETGAVLLRRLHPRITSYNDLVIFLMKCNMDIKFIGSGEAAKALLYYVTDYITKPSLPAHIGLAALSYAIQRTNEKFQSQPVVDDKVSKGALVMTVNRMISRQEISHQQVMSYLIGGGDVYQSHSFRVLHWGCFDRMFKRHFPSSDDVTMTDPVVDAEHDDEDSFILKLQPGSISATNQQQDYIYRPTASEFDSLPLYEYVGTVEKISKKYLKSTCESDHLDENEGPEQPADAEATRSRRGRRLAARGSFSSAEHTQYRTHCVRKRGKWIVPVLLGDRIPRPGRSDEETDLWARMMLILFVPWRLPSDLKHSDESWTDAYERQKSVISSRHLQIIENMNVLSECRDARDAQREMRRAKALAFMKDGLSDTGATHTGADNDGLDDTYQLFEGAASHDIFSQIGKEDELRRTVDGAVGERARQFIDHCYGKKRGNSSVELEPQSVSLDSERGPLRAREADDDSTLSLHQAIMRTLKGQRRPRVATQDEDDHARPAKKRRYNRRVDEEVTRAVLHSEDVSASQSLPEQQDGPRVVKDPASQAIEDIVQEMGLNDNPEQERAFRIIANHVRNPLPQEQLLMYISGVGGTGKTHVINSVLKLFDRLGR
ncbi:hypothetical protein C8Q76DRAFT_580390, partial [Earliella scabrosa]